jgi:hypothetical protein
MTLIHIAGFLSDGGVSDGGVANGTCSAITGASMKTAIKNPVREMKKAIGRWHTSFAERLDAEGLC